MRYAAPSRAWQVLIPHREDVPYGAVPALAPQGAFTIQGFGPNMFRNQRETHAPEILERLSIPMFNSPAGGLSSNDRARQRLGPPPADGGHEQGRVLRTGAR